MKRMISLVLLLALSGYSKTLSDEARLNCRQFGEQLDAYIQTLREDATFVKTDFEPIHQSWVGIKGLVPSSSQANRLENALNFHRLVLMNASVLGMYTQTSVGIMLPTDRLYEWRPKCKAIHELIDKEYLEYICRRTEGLDHPKEVKKILVSLVNRPTAICPPNRFPDSQIISEIIQLNFEEAKDALGQLME